MAGGFLRVIPPCSANPEEQVRNKTEACQAHLPLKE